MDFFQVTREEKTPLSLERDELGINTYSPTIYYSTLSQQLMHQRQFTFLTLCGVQKYIQLFQDAVRP